MKKKNTNFLSENFPFLVVKFSMYLNRSVFVMQSLNVLAVQILYGSDILNATRRAYTCNIMI